MNPGLPTPTPTIKALSKLAAGLKGAVLMGHSQSGPFPLDAALLDPSATRGLVLVEPGRCPDTYTDPQIKALATVPIVKRPSGVARSTSERWATAKIAESGCFRACSMARSVPARPAEIGKLTPGKRTAFRRGSTGRVRVSDMSR